MGKDESLYEIGRDIQVHRNKDQNIIFILKMLC